MTGRRPKVRDALTYAPVLGTALSHDGRWLAVVVPRYDAVAARRPPCLFVLDLDDPTAWRALGHPGATFHTPVFALDGRLFAFRQHGDVADAVVFDVPAGDDVGTAVAHLPPGAQAPGWRGNPPRPACLGRDGRGVRRVWVWDALDTRPRVVSTPLLDAGDFAFVAGTDRIAWLHSPPHVVGGARKASTLYLAPSLDRRPRPVALPEPLRGFLAWSPDGRWVAGIGRPVDAPLTSPRLWVVEAATGAARRLLADRDGWITGFDWRHDSGGLLVAMDVGVDGVLLDVDLDGTTRRWGPAHGYASGPRSDRARGRRVHLQQDLDDPQHVRVFAPGEDVGRRVTGFNARARGLALAPAETVRWSHDGEELEGLLLLPDRPRPPVVVWLHGGPAEHIERTFSMYFQLLVAEGWAVFAPNHRGSTGRSDAFLQALAGRVGEADVGDVLSGLDALDERVDTARVAYAGWSFGGSLALLCASVRPDGAQAVLAGAPVADWTTVFGARQWPSLTRAWFPSDPWVDPEPYDRASPARRIGTLRAPTLLLHGEADRAVPVAHSRLIYRFLQARGVSTDLRLYPGEGHVFGSPWAVQEMLARMIAWFRTHLDPSAPTPPTPPR